MIPLDILPMGRVEVEGNISLRVGLGMGKGKG